jgi:hypothetical protein
VEVEISRIPGIGMLTGLYKGIVRPIGFDDDVKDRVMHLRIPTIKASKI